MNDYFCSIGNELAIEIYDKPIHLLNRDYSVNMRGATYRFKEINPQDVSSTIGKFRSSTSFGVDMISTYFLKIALPYISLLLAFISNAPLRALKLPDARKIARVTPIYKDSEKIKDQISNLLSLLQVVSRLVALSLLHAVSRLVEKLVFQQFYDYLNNNKLLFSCQAGFRALHSNVSYFLKTTNDWYSALDNSKLVGVVFIDLKMACDTTDHSI